MKFRHRKTDETGTEPGKDMFPDFEQTITELEIELAALKKRIKVLEKKKAVL